MGLLDVLNGMQNGPRGPSTPGAGGSGGMSPLTMAILGLLAYKAVKSFTGGQTANPAGPGALPSGGTVDAGAPVGPAACCRADWAASSAAAMQVAS